MFVQRPGGVDGTSVDVSNGDKYDAELSPNSFASGVDGKVLNGSTLASASTGKQTSSVANKTQEQEGNFCHAIPVSKFSFMIPDSSLRSLVGKNYQILKRLKINLLDMDACLPNEAFRSSRANVMKRCAWRALVKSAESIFEVAQATILFEGMIKTEYLKNGWWYWSSLTAAARMPTISSLALRLFTLDDSMIYVKPSLPMVDPGPTESVKPANKTGRKRKEMEVDSCQLLAVLDKLTRTTLFWGYHESKILNPASFANSQGFMEYFNLLHDPKGMQASVGKSHGLYLSLGEIVIRASGRFYAEWRISVCDARP
ncbi:hypothetical protein J5N97_001674 [Dioscorea zingiberensis]|uniref:Uncharacterized protein n=1 Tax=Dioscorea zingiberensis TaxID=325984 RepID=A0A9D5H222_9LILI|nr:hypothetical protein J5N97_001674 [Dioscorea zingiberensis]